MIPVPTRNNAKSIRTTRARRGSRTLRFSNVGIFVHRTCVSSGTARAVRCHTDLAERREPSGLTQKTYPLPEGSRPSAKPFACSCIVQVYAGESMLTKKNSRRITQSSISDGLRLLSSGRFPRNSRWFQASAPSPSTRLRFEVGLGRLPEDPGHLRA
ncbi:hypothetical protein Poly59_55880 [Rubripirellula reticaptiva]|uniref:Uncharacterized protein n=1 Tax=Rubripirellula reticaptiva TaxID=2528013 RepID=A0A5C6EDQ8_9BACT|nr:hypothetical protein Poly59_55880 [Rubripirellula reticaptiva]